MVNGVSGDGRIIYLLILLDDHGLAFTFTITRCRRLQFGGTPTDWRKDEVIGIDDFHFIVIIVAVAVISRFPGSVGGLRLSLSYTHEDHR